MNNFLIKNMTSNEIEDKIKEYLPVKKQERDKNGEVFTPSQLINEMLDKFPISIWKNPNYKWLDPANGIGNFPMKVFERLNKGLSNLEDYKDEEKRKEHIIKNMLYMVELNPNNVAVSRNIFGENANIFCGSFLEDEWKEKFVIDKFDVIVGNPPYNKNGVRKGGSVFYKNFIFKGIDILKTNGYLLYVNPTGWRKPKGERASAGDIFERFKKGNLLYININDEKIKFFPTVDYYIWKNNDKYISTKYDCKFCGKSYSGNNKLYDLPFIPSLLNEEVINILNKLFDVSKKKFNIIRRQIFRPSKEDTKKKGIPHAYYYVPDKKEYIKVYKEYNETPEYILNRKVILTYKAGKKKGNLYPKYDDGNMGTTNNTMCQIVNDKIEGESLVNYFNSQLISFLLKITQYSISPFHSNEYKILNLINKPTNIIYNNEDVYNLYGLNKEEINLIIDILQESKKNKYE